jgi:lysophospholipase L1-like esterase
LKPSLVLGVRVLAVIGLVAVVLAVGGALLTGAAARRFTAIAPPATSSPASPSIPSPSIPSPSPAPAKPSLETAHVVAIGDSVTAGTNCDCTPFPNLYAKALATRYGIGAYVRNDGQGGETSGDVLDDLRGDDAEQADISRADIVVVTIGANDFGSQYGKVSSGQCGGSDGLSCGHDDLGRLQENLTAIVEQIHRLRAGAPTAVLLTGYWNVFEDGDVARRSMTEQGVAESDTLTRATNDIVEQVAGDQQATYVDLYTAFKGAHGGADPTELLADDGDHPNAAGHRLIAQALVAAGASPLTLG